MKNVKIYGSLDNHKEKLAELDKIHFTISLFDLIRKKYKINAVYLEEGFINLFVDKDGDDNYTFIEKSENNLNSEMHFDFSDIVIVNTQINYENKKSHQNHRFYVHELAGQIKIDNKKTNVIINSNCDVEYVQSNNKKYLSNKKLIFKGDLEVDTEMNKINISTVDFMLSSSRFNMKGFVNYEKNIYSLNINGDKTDFKTLISLLPNGMSKGLNKYKAKGNATFNVIINKEEEKYNFPKIEMKFGCSNVSLLETNTDKKLSNLSFNGEFSNGRKRDSKTSILKINDLKGSFDGNPFEAILTYKNFETPFINTYVKGKFPVSFFMQFSDSNHLKNVEGTLSLDFKLKAFQKDLENNNKEGINSSGEIKLNNVSFMNKDDFYHFKKLNGEFIFNKNDIAISNFTGMINNSDFIIEGYLRGFFSYFFNHKGKLHVMAELNSNNIDFDNLLESNHKEGDVNKEIENDYLKYVQFDLNANAQKVKWGKFNFSNVSGNVSHNDLIFVSSNIKGEIGNGSFGMNGSFDSRLKNDIKLKVNNSIDGIDIDSIFYYFNDFNENFITHNNLKGNVYLKSKAEMSFDQYLNLKPKSLLTDIDINVKNGALNNFEPMQNMSKFLGEDELKNIKFSELRNTIHVENQKIEIPEMRINSSVSNITIRGSHTFDQEIYYKIKVPLKNLKMSKRKEAETAFEDGVDGPTVHLIISGTTDNFEIKYDKSATKKIVKDKVKDEIREIRDIIKGTHQEEEEEQIELKEEDFFEFD